MELPRFDALGDADCPSDRVEARNKCIRVLAVHAAKEADPIDALVGNIPQLVSRQALSVAINHASGSQRGEFYHSVLSTIYFLDVFWL